MMKLTKIILIIAALNLISCSEYDPSIEVPEQILSPNGIFIANSVLELEAIIQDHVYAKVGYPVFIEIKDFQFYEDSLNTSCLINYSLQEGGHHNALYVLRFDETFKPERYMVLSCEGDCQILLDLESGEAQCENDCALIVNISEE